MALSVPQLCFALVAGLSVLVIFAHSAAVEPSPATADPAKAKAKEEPWKPVTEPQEFKVNVADGIQGANQIRYEKWDKGAMTGMFSKPLGDGKHEVVTYIADDKGYRITSTKVVDESELSKIQAGAELTPNIAQVDVQKNGVATSYTVTPDQIAPHDPEKTDAAQSQPAQKQS